MGFTAYEQNLARQSLSPTRRDPPPIQRRVFRCDVCGKPSDEIPPALGEDRDAWAHFLFSQHWDASVDGRVIRCGGCATFGYEVISHLPASAVAAARRSATPGSSSGSR